MQRVTEKKNNVDFFGLQHFSTRMDGREEEQMFNYPVKTGLVVVNLLLSDSTVLVESNLVLRIALRTRSKIR